jgi:hypothetical protein
LDEPFVELNWRTALAGSLLVGALLIQVVGPPEDGPAPDRLTLSDEAWHANVEAGFRLKPPPGWRKRVDDADGSRISPEQRAEDGFAWIVVSRQGARETDPKVVLQSMALKRAAGPVADLQWEEPERLVIDGPGEAATATFTQTWQGVALRGRMVVIVDGVRHIQASGVLPAGRPDAEHAALEEALTSLSLL